VRVTGFAASGGREKEGMGRKKEERGEGEEGRGAHLRLDRLQCCAKSVVANAAEHFKAAHRRRKAEQSGGGAPAREEEMETGRPWRTSREATASAGE
jgi:hypothetical protein